MALLFAVSIIMLIIEIIYAYLKLINGVTKKQFIKIIIMLIITIIAMLPLGNSYMKEINKQGVSVK